MHRSLFTALLYKRLSVRFFAPVDAAKSRLLCGASRLLSTAKTAVQQQRRLLSNRSHPLLAPFGRGDGSPSKWPVYTIMGINVVVFAQWQLARHQATQQRDPALWRWMQENFTVSSRQKVHTLLTSAFSHMDPMHLGVNMFMLYQLGEIMLGTLGTARFMTLYTASALGSSLCSVIYHHNKPYQCANLSGWLVG